MDLIISWNCFSKFNEIDRNNERAENKEIRKNQDFVQNLRRIAFAHQYEIISKFRAIFIQNIKKSLRNYCTIFVKIISIGNPNHVFLNSPIKRFTNLPKVDKLNWTRGLISLRERKYKNVHKQFTDLKGLQRNFKPWNLYLTKSPKSLFKKNSRGNIRLKNNFVVYYLNGKSFLDKQIFKHNKVRENRCGPTFFIT